jgi:hypothetical protein
MDFNQFNKLKSLLLEEEFCLSYSGFMSEDILEAVGQTLRDRLEEVQSPPRQIRQVFSIFVELMQNVIRYGDDGPQRATSKGLKPSYGMLLVSKKGDELVLYSGNFIATVDAERISARLDELKGRTPDELRQIYKEKLRQPTEKNSKGASLGLIEIARRSSQPPEYQISKGSGGMSFFVIKASA